MSNPPSQFDRHVESVLAALEIMDCFLGSPKLTIKEIMDITNLTRNRVTRLLGTLMYMEYIMEGVDESTFVPGPKLMVLGNIFAENQSLVPMVRTVLKTLVLQTGETATFHVREGAERQVLVEIEGSHAIRYAATEGQKGPLHAGAPGKVLLAHVPEVEREIILSRGPLSRFTESTITTPGQLLRELESIRTQGYAVSLGEFNRDAFSLAVPVFQQGSKIIGALSLGGPVSRLDPELQERYLRTLIKAGTDLSARFN